MRRAGGGPTSGLFEVGEQGRELLNLGSTKGFVHDAKRFNSSFGGGDGGGESVVRIVFDGPGFREFFRKDVKQAGGTKIYFGEN